LSISLGGKAMDENDIVDPEDMTRRSKPNLDQGESPSLTPSRRRPVGATSSGATAGSSARDYEEKHAETGAKPPARGKTASPKTGKETKMTLPVVVDLGSISRKEVRRLKRGRGRKIEDALRAAAETKAAGTAEPDAPIILLYRRRNRRRRSLFPFPFVSPF
jgi:hypothetical protein